MSLIDYWPARYRSWLWRYDLLGPLLETWPSMDLKIILALTDCTTLSAPPRFHVGHYPDRGWMVDLEGHRQRTGTMVLHKERWFREQGPALACVAFMQYAVDGCSLEELEATFKFTKGRQT